jgi:hypothetical protein
LKALGIDPAVARELGYPLKDPEEPESNLAAQRDLDMSIVVGLPSARSPMMAASLDEQFR